MNPVDPRTGVIAGACQGVVDASEGDLAVIAEQVMERSGTGWSRCRVVFFVGDRRQDEVPHDAEVFGTVAHGDRVFVPGPAHPGFGPGAQPPIAPQPKPLGKEPWKDHGLADRQVVECGSCRADLTVRLAKQGTFFLSTPENLRGTALICGDCGRLLCIDCLTPAVDLPFDPHQTSCDRCGGTVSPLMAADGQATSPDPR